MIPQMAFISLVLACSLCKADAIFTFEPEACDCGSMAECNNDQFSCAGFLCREPLAADGLFPNRALREEIQEWLGREATADSAPARTAPDLQGRISPETLHGRHPRQVNHTFSHISGFGPQTVSVVCVSFFDQNRIAGVGDG